MSEGNYVPVREVSCEICGERWYLHLGWFRETSVRNRALLNRLFEQKANSLLNNHRSYHNVAEGGAE